MCEGVCVCVRESVCEGVSECVSECVTVRGGAPGASPLPWLCRGSAACRRSAVPLRKRSQARPVPARGHLPLAAGYAESSWTLPGSGSRHVLGCVRLSRVPGMGVACLVFVAAVPAKELLSVDLNSLCC